MTHINTTVRLLIATMMLVAFTFFLPVSVSAQVLIDADGVQKQTPVPAFSSVRNDDLVLASEKQATHIDISAFYRSPIVKEDFKGISTSFTFYHRGLDYPADVNSKVYAVTEGTVHSVSYEAGGYGKYVVVKHNNGLMSLYAHLSKTEVNVGDAVTAETVLGYIGMTGRTTGPHLHFELLSEGIAINPLQILPSLE